MKEYRYKQNSLLPCFFRLKKQSDNTVIVLSTITNATFAIKKSTIDPAALVSYTLADPELTLDISAKNEVKVVFNISDDALLIPGVYVAEIWLKDATSRWASETIRFIVQPRIAGVP